LVTVLGTKAEQLLSRKTKAEIERSSDTSSARWRRSHGTAVDP